MWSIYPRTFAKVLAYCLISTPYFFYFVFPLRYISATTINEQHWRGHYLPLFSWGSFSVIVAEKRDWLFTTSWVALSALAMSISLVKIIGVCPMCEHLQWKYMYIRQPRLKSDGINLWCRRFIGQRLDSTNPQKTIGDSKAFDKETDAPTWEHRLHPQKIVNKMATKFTTH